MSADRERPSPSPEARPGQLPREPIARAAYDELASRYAALAEGKAENGYNEHPAMRAQIGDVHGRDVLDAGCGPGFLVRHLQDAGAASVVGFDVSEKMITLARERAHPGTRLFVGDLAAPQPGLADASMDLVVSSLAIDYVRDWSTPLSEFRRVLRSGGRLVMSVQHPMGSYKWFQPPSAFGVHLCEATWSGFGGEPVVVPDYYRSFEEIVTPVLAAGFVLVSLKETRPVPELEAVDPRRYRKGMAFPTFMVIEARMAQ